MKDIPELAEVRFVAGVLVQGRSMSTQVRATKDVKASLVGDSILITSQGRLACVVPLSNVAYMVPAAAAPAITAATPRVEAKK